MTELPIVIRDAVADDYRFILHSWARSFSVSDSVRKLGLSEWLACKSYAKLLERRLHEMSIVIASNPEDQTQIFGYMVYEGPKNATTLHFIYTKDYLRGEKIAQRLLASCPVTYKATSYPKSGFANRFLNVSFNPFHLLGIYIEDPKEIRHDTIEVRGAVSGHSSRA